MRTRWLVALVVICAFVWVSAAVAGPARPVGGDPDIWERCKTTTPNYSVGCLPLHARLVSAIDLVLYKVTLKQQDAKQGARADTSNRPPVSKRDRSWR